MSSVSQNATSRMRTLKRGKKGIWELKLDLGRTIALKRNIYHYNCYAATILCVYIYVSDREYSYLHLY